MKDKVKLDRIFLDRAHETLQIIRFEVKQWQIFVSLILFRDHWPQQFERMQYYIY